MLPRPGSPGNRRRAVPTVCPVGAGAVEVEGPGAVAVGPGTRTVAVAVAVGPGTRTVAVGCTVLVTVCVAWKYFLSTDPAVAVLGAKRPPVTARKVATTAATAAIAVRPARRLS